MRRIFLILDDKVLEGLGSKTLVELREIAKELKIKSITTYKKNELIEIINSKSKNEEMIAISHQIYLIEWSEIIIKTIICLNKLMNLR